MTLSTLEYSEGIPFICLATASPFCLALLLNCIHDSHNHHFPVEHRIRNITHVRKDLLEYSNFEPIKIIRPFLQLALTSD